MLVEQRVERLDQLRHAAFAYRVLVEGDDRLLVGGARQLAVHDLGVDGQQHLEVEVGVADAPLSGRHQIVEERRPTVREVDERDDGEGLWPT